MTIRLKILTGCFALALLTGLLGLYTQVAERRLGKLAIDVYDNAFMAVSYLRSAEVAFARLSAQSHEPGWSPSGAAGSEQDMLSDLDVVRDRAMTKSGRSQAVALKAHLEALLPHLQADPEGAEAVRTDFEELVETFAGDAYQYRKGAQLMVAREIRDSSAVIGVGLVLAVGMTVLIKVAAGREEKERRERQEAAATNSDLNRLSQNLSEALKKAEQANDAKSRFLAGVTHELRTPLHGMLGYAELLSLEGDLNATQTARLETMMAAGQHLLGMINSVLDMSQIEAERMDLQPEVLSLAALVQVCINVVRPKADGRGLGLRHTEFPAVSVNADPTRLRQVLINLLGNAVKFTPSGHIEVRMRCLDSGDAVRVEVADTGPGVRAMHRDKLFKTFERLNAAAVAGIEGSGLGLSIAAKLVHLMGGRIGYDDNPTGGSIFWVELPICESVPEALIAAPAEAASADLPKLRVLIADDEALNRSIAGSFLGRAGHTFTCVENGALAVEAALAEDFDVILMDVRMPVMNGMDATRRIRADGGPRSRVRILAVTAQGFSEQLALCQQAGMDGHVSKPFTMATLLGALPTETKKPVAPPDRPPVQIDTRRIFEREIFMDTVEYMPPEEVMDNLRMLIERCQEMSALMHGEQAAAPEAIVDIAHKLAGASGMFGLLETSEAARALEHAAAAGQDSAAIVARLDSALEASIAVLQEELEAMMAV
jgi:signal transduction histidine kinase/FixJ family two-component response regulator/HPt (histidine-containing phosphotransfer) domain-containing protein